MAFHPNSADHVALDKFLALVLDAYKEGRANRDSCVGSIAQVMTAAAIDNDGEFKNYIRLTEKELLLNDD